MTLPFTTNTVTVEDAASTGDKWEPRTYGTPQTGVPCVIAVRNAVDSQGNSGGITETLDCHFDIGTVTVSEGARITDEETLEIFYAGTVVDRRGLGLDRLRVSLRRTEGA